jgi:hypothetical protein
MSYGRIYAEASRFSISRTGYEVRTAPRTPDYMAVDSSFPAALRLLQSGVLLGVQTYNIATVFYGTTYAAPPFVELYLYNRSIQRTEQNVNIEVVNQGTHTYGSAFFLRQYTDRFTFNGFGSTVETNPGRDFIYFVYPP